MNTLTTLLQADWAELAGWTLLHSVWQIALVAAAYAIATLVLRHRSASARYVLGCVAILTMLGLPVATYGLLTSNATPTPIVASRMPAVEIAVEPPIELSTPPSGVIGPFAVSPDVLPPILPPAASVELSPVVSVAAEPVSTTLHSRFSRYLPWATAVWLTLKLNLVLIQKETCCLLM